MAVTIVPTRQPLDATQQGLLRKLFDSPAYSLLKEVVVARCIEHQVDSMKAALYPASEAGAEDARREQAVAVEYNAVLDILDDLEKQEQELWTVKLEPRR